ncbi:MAG: signal peptidase II [bacterium]
MREALKWYMLAAVILAADLATKAWISRSFYYGEVRSVNGFLNLVLVHNPGAAFSFLSDAGGWQRWFFVLLSVAVSGWLCAWLFRLQPHRRRLKLALSLILGGALGNLWDRLTLGYVVDFIDVYYQSWHWPAFNLADSAITLGVLLLLWDGFRDDEGKATEKSADKTAETKEPNQVELK